MALAMLVGNANRLTVSLFSPANTLAALLQAGVMYRRYQEAQANPDLAQALDGVSVTPHGDRLEVRIPVSEDQMGALLRSRTFAVPIS
jgi:hypothetical protein